MTRIAGEGPGTGESAVPVEDLQGEQPGERPATGLVVGFDSSAASIAALGKAAELGGRLGAELHVVHAVDLSDYPVDPDAEDWDEQAARALDEESRRVSAALAGYPCRWSYVVVRGEPAEALDRVACEVEAAMIVVGVRAHGWRHRLERLASPSISHRLTGHCRVPVLVVPYHEQGRAG